MPLELIADDVWTDHEPMRFAGLPLGRRVTAIRTQADEVVVFSPLSWSHARQAELEALGKVSLMVVPSRWHDRYFDQYMDKLPGCRFAGSAGVRANHESWNLVPLESCAETLREFEWYTLPGMPSVEETVFFHRPSRTLVLADVLFNLGLGETMTTRLLFRLAGIGPSPGPSRLEKFLIRDRRAFAEGWRRVLAWDVARIAVGHGQVIDREAKRVLREAYAYLL
ncbi:hypothetical protein CMV30_15525 [Nibricoccus aquaticus]|uniref:DUF4336 domain-containing protein n=1 Tax=Nibricoccus aquaticus TaxID=2576891 RepID=A0A290Q9D3_9BACT|nr:hypothetical protein [Nibricoccus aquaticus]ATC65249.1 hypothetical protein CMV30_15525 [Nibricoccus aquaticus]